MIVLDHHIIGLYRNIWQAKKLECHGAELSFRGKKSSRGRYFGMHGDGVGGTAFLCAIDVVKDVDKERAKPGMTLLLPIRLERRGNILNWIEDFNFRKRELPPKAEQLADEIAGNCEKSLVSVVYTGGAGGSARGGVTRCPIKLTEAVHAKKSKTYHWWSTGICNAGRWNQFSGGYAGNGRKQFLLGSDSGNCGTD